MGVAGAATSGGSSALFKAHPKGMIEVNLSIIAGAAHAAWRRTGVMARVATLLSILLSTQAPVVTTVAHARISTTWVDNAASTPVHDHWMADLGGMADLAAGRGDGPSICQTPTAVWASTGNGDLR